MELEGKVALVTGGTSGIGREVAKQLAALGAEVVVSGRDPVRGAETVAELEAAGGNGRFIAADLADFGAIGRLAQEVGELDILVNNAGIFDFAPTPDESRENFEAMFDVNVRAPYFLTAALAPKMAGRGGGAIVNVSTMVAARGAAGMAAYGASKAALESLTHSWAAEYGPQGVRVNAVALGPTRTPVTAGLGPMLDTLAAAAPLGRPAEPSEIAAAILYLAGDASSFITGAVVPVDGGRTTTL
jgi:NAD(P)-dependent dehydrogenase (short-subunit alcohol dehydrogenase family)